MLKELPTSLMSLLEITFEAIVIVDNWWRCLAASSAASHLLQHSQQELQDQALFKGWRGVDYERDWRAALERGRGQGFWKAIDTQDVQRSIGWHFVAGVAPHCHLVLFSEEMSPEETSICRNHQEDGQRMKSVTSRLDVLPPVRSQVEPVPQFPLCSSPPLATADRVQKKASTIQALPFPMVLLDSGKRVYAVNDAYRKQFAAMADPLGSSLAELWGRQAAQAFDRAFLRLEQAGAAIGLPIQLELGTEDSCLMQVGIAVDPPSSELEPEANKIQPVARRYYYLSLFPTDTDKDGLGLSENPECEPECELERELEPAPEPEPTIDIVEINARIEEFKTALGYSSDGIARFNRGGHLIYANATLMRWWKCSAASMMGKSYTKIELFQHWGTSWQMMFEQVLASGRQQTLESKPFIFGHDQALQAQILPETDATGTVQSLLVIFRDITTIKRAQHALVSQASHEYTLRLISQHIRESLDLDRILASAVTGIQRTLQADRVLIYRFTDDHRTKIVWEAATSDCPIPVHLRQRHSSISEQCRRFLQRSERTWIVPDTSKMNNPCSDATGDTESFCLFASFGDLKAMGVRSQMVAAIVHTYPKQAPTVWGILVAQACAIQREWQVDEADLLYEVAGQLAIGIKHAELIDQLNQQSQYLTATNIALMRANTQLKELSELDGLTKIANRRRFDNTLTQEWQRLSRSQAPLSFVLFDVDHFKLYNDTHGHPAGDKCLIQIARTALQQLGRPTDLLARYGGEEFIVLLPETDVRGAIIVAEAIRQAVWDLAIVNHYVHGKPVFVSVSLGVASCIPTRDGSPAAAINAVDRVLYQAKERGRNLWVCAN